MKPKVSIQTKMNHLTERRERMIARTCHLLNR